MPIRVLCSRTVWRAFLKVLVLVALVFGNWAGHPLEQWERIFTLPNSGLVGIAAGKGPDGKSIIVVAEGTGNLITWPQDEPTNRSTFTTTNEFRSITYGNERFVAGSLYGPIVTSTNGYDWESVPVDLSDVKFANGVFLGKRGAGLMRSTNGVDWTTEANPTTQVFPTFHLAGNYFVLGTPGTNFLSTDGLNWTPANSGTTNRLYTIGYGRGMFVAVATGNELLTSRDAMTWEGHGKLKIGRVSNVAVGNGYLVMMGGGEMAGGGVRAYSKYGQNWKVVPSGKNESSVVFANGRFIACGYEEVYQSGEVLDVEISSAGSLVVNGVPNKKYQIEAANVLRDGDTEWDVRHVFKLGEDEYEWQEMADSEVGAVFYRVSEDLGGE
jgi:hypothetical protein